MTLELQAAGTVGTETYYRFPSPSTCKDFSASVYRFLNRSGLRHLFELQKASQPLLNKQELTLWLDNLANEVGSKHLAASYDLPNTKKSITVEQLAAMADSAADFVLLKWDPHYSEIQSLRGQKSKRPSALMSKFKKLEGQSISQQAKALGCSERQVSNLRAQVKREAELNADGELWLDDYTARKARRDSINARLKSLGYVSPDRKKAAASVETAVTPQNMPRHDPSGVVPPVELYLLLSEDLGPQKPADQEAPKSSVWEQLDTREMDDFMADFIESLAAPLPDLPSAHIEQRSTEEKTEIKIPASAAASIFEGLEL